MYGYEWTEENGIFRLTINAKIQKEIRPVFHEELDFFGMDQYWDYPKDTTAPLLWAEGVRRYVLNGVCVAEAQGGGFYTKPTIKRLTEERLKLVPIDTDRLYEVNRQIMLSLEQKAVQFIQTQYEHYLPLGFSFVCAFSGGKDSLVLLGLMTKALAPKDYYVVFSNTVFSTKKTCQRILAGLFLHIRLLAHPACKEPIRFVTRRVKHLAMLADALRVEPGVQPALVTACSL